MNPVFLQTFLSNLTAYFQAFCSFLGSVAKGLHHFVTVTLGKTFDRARKAFVLIRLEVAESCAVSNV